MYNHSALSRGLRDNLLAILGGAFSHQQLNAVIQVCHALASVFLAGKKTTRTLTTLQGLSYSDLAYDSIAAACDDTSNLLKHNPSAVELVPQMLIRLARGVPEYARQMGWVIGDPAALLVVEFSGDDPWALKESARSIGDVFTLAESKDEQARTGPLSNVLASAIGGPELLPTVGVLDLVPGDALLLCTDGLTKHVTDDAIRAVLASDATPEQACRTLVDAALAGGGSDNVTVVVARAS